MRAFKTTDAARHDGAVLREIVTRDNTASDVWADTAYRSKANEAWLHRMGRVSRIHHRKPKGRPMPDRIAKANAAYQAGNLGTATTELNYALTRIGQLLAKRYQATFPPAPDGWKAGRVRSSSGNAMVRVQGQMLSARYSQPGGRSRIEAQLIVDSPAMQVYATLFANANYARAAGYDPVKLDGIAETAMVKFDDTRKRGDLLLMMGSRILIKLTGYQIASADALTGMIRGWKLADLKKAAGIK